MSLGEIPQAPAEVATNPVPAAVRHAVKALKPQLVAVELDEASGCEMLRGSGNKIYI